MPVIASGGIAEGGSAIDASAVAIHERDRLTGGWWGVRGDLDEAGVAINGEYTAELSGVTDGGLRRRFSFRNILTLDAELDLGTILGVHGGTAFVQYLSVNPERGGSEDAGDLQGYSNIENAKHLDALYEAWYEQTFAEGKLRFKVGKVDANSEFAALEAAGGFANSSAGFSPTVAAFPSYPDPSMSINAFVRVLDTAGCALTLGYGLYDGTAAQGVAAGGRAPSIFLGSARGESLFHIGQAELAWEGGSPTDHAGTLGGGRLALGMWAHTADFVRFDGGTAQGAHGFFALAEQQLCRTRDDDPSAGLVGFVQLGLADGSVSKVEGHYALGLVLEGVGECRPNDSIGLYASLADLSDDAAAGFDKDELALDAYYRIHITPAISVQPEVQYIVNPSGDPDTDDALVLGIRVGVTF